MRLNTGREEGRSVTLFGLVRDGLPSLDEAASRARSTEAEFVAKMDEYLKTIA